MIKWNHGYILLTLILTFLSLETNYYKIVQDSSKELKRDFHKMIVRTQHLTFNFTLNLNYELKVIIMLGMISRCLEVV